MKKRLFILVLTAALMGSLTACSTDTEADNAVPATEDIEATEQTEVVAELETEDIIPETETEEPTEAVVPETETETEQAEAYTVTDMSATKYAKSSVNVRKGPSSDYEKLGGLSTNQQVAVTGQADTGWYRIEYNGEAGFVSDKYLVDEKVAVNTTPTQAAPTQNQSTPTDTTTQQNIAITTTQDNTQQTQDNSGWTGDASTDTSTPATSTPAVDNSAPTTDTSTSTPATDNGGTHANVDYSKPTMEFTDDVFDPSANDAYDVGVGGDWIE